MWHFMSLSLLIYIYIYMDTNMQCCVLWFPDSDLEVSVIFYWTLRFGVLLSQHRRILKGGSTSDLLFGKKTNTRHRLRVLIFSLTHTRRLHLIWQQSWKKYRLTEVYVWQSFQIWICEVNFSALILDSLLYFVVLYTQGCLNSVLEGRCPAEFSFSLPQHTCMEVSRMPS